ncbi:hypothetical protein OA385_05660, partial [Paracoccaceae bacterium]|nr:hypothetical protein [Paracoccaceae bacterium]
HNDGHVDVNLINCDCNLKKKLEESIIVFFTGRTRNASEILANQIQEINLGGKRKLISRMVELSYEMKKELESGSIENFGSILDENWRLKSQLTADISDSYIDEIYKIGIENGALGGKLMGAGHGGFMMFFAPPEKHHEIKVALKTLRQLDCKFDNKGSQIILGK